MKIKEIINGSGSVYIILERSRGYMQVIRRLDKCNIIAQVFVSYIHGEIKIHTKTYNLPLLIFMLNVQE